MRVLLKNNWYTPNRQFFLAGTHTLPDSFEKILPKSAKILEVKEEVDEIEEAEKPAEKPAEKSAVAEKKK